MIGLLQLTARHKSAAPVNRQLGDDMIIAGSVFDEEARQRYPEGWTAPAVLDPRRPAAQMTPSAMQPAPPVSDGEPSASRHNLGGPGGTRHPGRRCCREQAYEDAKPRRTTPTAMQVPHATAS